MRKWFVVALAGALSLAVPAVATVGSKPPSFRLPAVVGGPVHGHWRLEDHLGKEPIVARDRSGFIVNLLLVPFLLDAIRALEHGVGTVGDIDRGMQLGCGHPMGPLTLLDFVGLDTTLRIAEIMFQEYREKRFAPPPLLKRMVLAGRYGKKSGRGFYEYGERS